MTQKDQVLQHLSTPDPDNEGRFLSLSPLEAFGLYRITRLADIIWQLREHGLGTRQYPDDRFCILDTLRKDRTGRRYARYSLKAGCETCLDMLDTWRQRLAEAA